ncbi:MAG: homocysteine S-methyltransferase family protein [Candidatus Omnitrophota bacterium]
MKEKIAQLLRRKVLLLDGATGTELQHRGMPPGVCPENWCLDHPDVLVRVHADYFAAGADIVYTCTFGANRIKLSEYKIKDVFSVNKKLAEIARRAAGKSGLVAGDIGPTGRFVEPFGDLAFEEAVEIFKEQVRGLLEAGVDLLVIETMMDIQEARAALLAVKELADIFTIVTLTFDKGGRTLHGNEPVSSLITLQSLGADAVGCNCSTGPLDMLRCIQAMQPYATVPLVAKPNAGIPRLIDGKTVFTMQPRIFAKISRKLICAGAHLLGGCCGTTPEHIRYLKAQVARIRPEKSARVSLCALSSARGHIVIGKKNKVIIVGEKINPTGKKKMQAELLKGKLTLVRQFAKTQEVQGAKLLDVNVGVPGIDEVKTMRMVISSLALTTDLPLVIDSAKIETIGTALRLYPGRALINSISAEGDKLPKLAALAKKYGAMCILLPLAGKQIPHSFNQRRLLIRALVAQLRKAGIPKDDIIVDVLALAVSCYPGSAQETLKTIAWCTRILKCRTIIGLSNISFGLPQRHRINRVFLDMAGRKGLTFAIADPEDTRPLRDTWARNLLRNKDRGGIKYIEKYRQQDQSGDMPKKVDRVSPRERIFTAIMEGERDGIGDSIRNAIHLGAAPEVLMQEVMIPALVKVGTLFEKKQYFLPQLIASAQAMKEGFKVVEPFLQKSVTGQSQRKVILLATVEGDIHDIGKNIVALMLKNHGFIVIDLGKDVSRAKIVTAIKKHNPDIVGLSALMTTTMVHMGGVVKAAQKEGLQCKFMVGGAVVNSAYANSIGAAYAKDAVEAVSLAKQL